jgi:hypothetical protein
MIGKELLLIESPTLTIAGWYIYDWITLAGAKRLVEDTLRGGGVVRSMLTSELAADLARRLLKMDISTNKSIVYRHRQGNSALVFDINAWPKNDKGLIDSGPMPMGHRIGIIYRAVKDDGITQEQALGLSQ